MSRTWNRFNNYLVLAALSQLGVTCIMMETGQRTRTSTEADLLVPRSPPWLCESSAQLIVPVSRMVSQSSYQTLLELSIVICITLWYMHRIGSTLVHLLPSVTPDIIHSFYANPPENQDHNLGKSVYHLQEDARSRASSSIWHRPKISTQHESLNFYKSKTIQDRTIVWGGTSSGESTDDAKGWINSGLWWRLNNERMNRMRAQNHCLSYNQSILPHRLQKLRSEDTRRSCEVPLSKTAR